MSRKGFIRSDLIVCVGGGVAADMAGLAASLYMGGIKFVHVPTDLLSACDSCISGRNFVNLSGGKSFCGSVCFPSAVYVDTEAIGKTGSGIFDQGMVEVIRSAIMGSDVFFSAIESGGTENRIEETVSECLRIKNGLTGKSGSEINERRIINLGKIFARAVSCVTNFKAGYHKSLGTGLAMTLRVSFVRGYCDRSVLDRTVALLERHNLILSDNFSFSDIKKAILCENKIGKGHLNFVVPYAIGDCRLVKVDLKELDSWIRDAVEFEPE
jgi:3-dehydroquinate synthase